MLLNIPVRCTSSWTPLQVTESCQTWENHSVLDGDQFWSCHPLLAPLTYCEQSHVTISETGHYQRHQNSLSSSIKCTGRIKIQCWAIVGLVWMMTNVSLVLIWPADLLQSLDQTRLPRLIHTKFIIVLSWYWANYSTIHTLILKIFEISLLLLAYFILNLADNLY